MTGYRLDQYGGLAEVLELKSGPNGEVMIPAGVLVSPDLPEQMTLAEGQNLVLDGVVWTVKENHIGETYWEAGAKYGDEPKKMAGYGPLPEGATTTPPAEPTELELFLDSIKDMDAEALRSHLYSTQRYRFVDDDISKGSSDVAMCLVDGKAMTVDEASQEWLRYFGDDDTKAQAALAQKSAAKDYIRTAVSAYKEEE